MSAMIEKSARETLRRQLLAVGFDVVYFAQTNPNALIIPETAALRAWLDAAMQADMHWMERGFEKRANPQLVLPDVQSVIVLGVNYHAKTQNASAHADASLRNNEQGNHDAHEHRPADAKAQPLWARYSLYSDYHDTIKPALEKVGRVLEETFGILPADYRYYVDTGPVLERAWAEHAGAGFVGKNAMLISRDFGNWLFLAAIYVRKEIVPDERLFAPPSQAQNTNRVGLLCGKCTRCIDACPTGAIVRASVVDARLCISYQTIENKGVIPRELRPAIGTHIYGCDVCAEVCPWNRFAQKARSVLLESRDEIGRLSLNELLALTPEKFAALFRKTAIKRTKLPGLLRNACVVAGNVYAGSAAGAKTAGVLPLLEKLTMHESELVRAHAVWAVFRILGTESARVQLHDIRAKEKAAAVISEYV